MFRPQPASRPFHSSRHLLQDLAAQNHYETLNVPFGAHVTDIKKSFYKLSKVHHPDHNPQDPHAPRRFMRISEAYAVLSHTDKRAAYDREVMRHHGGSHHHLRGQHRPSGSYSSTGPAGGRPASGLSRRRSAFRGPPPSFYRNTGSGHSKAYAGNTAHTDGGNAQQSSTRTGGSTANAGQDYGPWTRGPGNVNADDTGTRSSPNTPNFDWNKKEQTHRKLSERILERRAMEADTKAFREETSTMFEVVFLSMAIVVAFVVPAILWSTWTQDSRERKARPKTAQKEAKNDA